jgi:hypothetical protein
MPAKILIVEKSRDELPRGEKFDAHFNTCSILMDGIKKLLVEEGYEVTCAHGLEKLREHYAHHDCVLVHPTPKYILPLYELREKYPQVRLIITPGYTLSIEKDLQVSEIQRDCEGIRIMSKPFSADSLLEAIAQSQEDKTVFCCKGSCFGCSRNTKP